MPSINITGPLSVQQGLLQINGGNAMGTVTLGGGTLAVNNAAAAGATQSTTIGALSVTALRPWTSRRGPLGGAGVPFFSGAGSLTLDSTATINVDTWSPLVQGKEYPLFQMTGGALAGSSGAAGLVLGSLPPRVTAHLDTTTLPGSVLLDVTSATTLKWSGTTSNWNATNNWLTVVTTPVSTITGSATTYNDSPGDAVSFDDTAKSGSVTLAAVVHPYWVNFNNNSLKYTLSGAGGIGGSGPLFVNGIGNVTLATNNTYTGGTFVTGGTLNLGDGATASFGSIVGNVALSNNAVLAFNRPDAMLFAGSITGAGSLVQAGSGMTILTGTNTYIGSTLVSNGTLQLGNGGVTGSILIDPNNNPITNNGTLVFDLNTTTVLLDGNSVPAIAGSGTVVVNAGTLQLGDGATTTGTISGPIVDNATLVVSPPPAYGAPVSFANAVSGSGGVVLTGANLWTLTGSSSYTGPTTISGGGTLSTSSMANVGSTSSSASLMFSSGGMLNYSGSTVTTSHGLTLSGSVTTVQVDNAGQTLTFTGPVSGGGGLINAGPGALALTGPGLLTGTIVADANTTVPSISVPAPSAAVTPPTMPTSPGSVVIAPGAVLAVTGSVDLNASTSGLVYEITGTNPADATSGGTLALLQTNSSLANPDIFANVHSNAYWGVAISTAINLGSGSRFIEGQAGNNNYGEYGEGDLLLSGPLYGTASVSVSGAHLQQPVRGDAHRQQFRLDRAVEHHSRRRFGRGSERLERGKQRHFFAGRRQRGGTLPLWAEHHRWFALWNRRGINVDSQRIAN